MKIYDKGEEDAAHEEDRLGVRRCCLSNSREALPILVAVIHREMVQDMMERHKATTEKGHTLGAGGRDEDGRQG
jgi:hypothetical protein